jgi:hypothetical protein
MRAAVTAVIIEMALSRLIFLTCSLRAVNTVIAKSAYGFGALELANPRNFGWGVDPPVEFSVVMAQTRRKRPHEPVKISAAHRHLPIPMLQVDDERERHPGIIRPTENGASDDRRPRIEVLIHTVGALRGERSLRAALKGPL